MMLSSSYQTLELQLELLKENFLNFEDSESQEQINQNKLRAFIILSHAELEHYFESIAIDCFNYGKEIWQNEGSIHPILFNIIIFCGAEFSGNESMATHQKMIDERIIENYKRILSNNHGIRQENILKLFVPLGISVESFETGWLPTIDSYGSKRGNLAHKSCAIKESLYKPDYLNKIKIIKTGIKCLDLLVQELKALKRYPLGVKALWALATQEAPHEKTLPHRH